MQVVRFKNDKKESEEMFNFLKIVDKDFYPPISQSSEGPLIDYFNNIVEKCGILYLKDKGKIIGMISYYYKSKQFSCTYINTLAVLREYRGRKLGNLLLKECIKDIKNRNLNKIMTRTWSTNPISLRLYESFGFKVHHIVKDDRGKGVDSIYVELNI